MFERDVIFNSKIGWYKILFILAIFEDLNYTELYSSIWKILSTFWYLFCIVLSKGLDKTTRWLSKLFSVFISVYLFQTQTHQISVVLLQC